MYTHTHTQTQGQEGQKKEGGGKERGNSRIPFIIDVGHIAQASKDRYSSWHSSSSQDQRKMEERELLLVVQEEPSVIKDSPPS